MRPVTQGDFLKPASNIDLSPLLEAVLGASPFGFIVYRLEGPCIWANHAAARLVGAELQQVLEQDFRSIASWQRTGLLEAAEQALATDQAVRRQLSFTSTFGKQAQLEIDFGTIQLGEQRLLLLATSEITDLMAANLERESAQTALARSQAEFRAIVEAHPDAILVLDEQQRVRFANPQAGVMLGHAGHRLLGKPYALAARSPTCTDVDITRADGTRGCAEPRTASTHWKGLPARLVTLHDITELRRTEEDLRQSEQALAERRQRLAVDRLAGSVAHNLNNQLMVLRGHIEMLEEDLADDVQAQRRLPVLFDALDRLQQLGRGVMDLGRPQPEIRETPAGSSDASTAAQVVGPPVAPTILLAEDEDQLRVMVAEALTARGFQVLEAAHGAAALALSREHDGSIDLLLTDVVMPGMDGVELYEALIQERPGVGVLYMSGYAESDYAQLHALAAQGRYLQKPFSIHYLAGKVEQALADG